MFQLMVVTQVCTGGTPDSVLPVVTVVNFNTYDQANKAEEKLTSYPNTQALEAIGLKQVVTKLYE